MDLFEYILIMTSVIFAMAVAQLLLGFSRLAQSSVRIRPYLAHSVWALILFVMIFANWWANWEFRSMAWTLPIYAYMLIAPTLFFFACTLLVPQDFEHDEVDLAEHFLRIRQPFLWAFLVASFAILIDGSLLADEPLWHPGRVGHAAIVFGALWGIGTQNKRTHNAIALCVLSGLVWAMYSRLESGRLKLSTGSGFPSVELRENRFVGSKAPEAIVRRAPYAHSRLTSRASVRG